MDELDALINGALEAEGAIPDAEPTPTDPEGEEATELTAPVEEELTPIEDSDEELEGQEEDPQPETPEGTEEPSGEVVEEPQTPAELAAAQATIAKQQALLQSILAAQQQQADAAKAEKARVEREERISAEIAALEKRWAEMDPEDAARDQLAVTTRIAQDRIAALEGENQRILSEQASARAVAEEAAAKQQVIPLIMQKFGLKEADREVLADLDNPLAMEKVGAFLQSQRQTQTKAARTAKADKLRQNPAIKPVAPGGGKPAFQQQYESVDELIDSLF